MTTEAGILPRSLMVNPLRRAQERTSALLGAASGPGGTGGDCSASRRLSAEASVRTAVVAVRVFPVGVLPRGGLLVLAGEVLFASMDGGSSASSAETASATPYSAPTTRIASSRGSVESKVSFTAVAFRGVETPKKLEVTHKTSKAASGCG